MQIQDHDELPKFDRRSSLPPAKRSLANSARPPATPGMPGMASSHENWGNFKCHKWGECGATHRLNRFPLFPFKRAAKKLGAVLAAARDGLATLRSARGCTGGRAVQWVC